MVSGCAHSVMLDEDKVILHIYGCYFFSLLKQTMDSAVICLGGKMFPYRGLQMCLFPSQQVENRYLGYTHGNYRPRLIHLGGCPRHSGIKSRLRRMCFRFNTIRANYDYPVLPLLELQLQYSLREYLL